MTVVKTAIVASRWDPPGKELLIMISLNTIQGIDVWATLANLGALFCITAGGLLAASLAAWTSQAYGSGWFGASAGILAMSVWVLPTIKFAEWAGWE